MFKMRGAILKFTPNKPNGARLGQIHERGLACVARFLARERGEEVSLGGGGTDDDDGANGGDGSGGSGLHPSLSLSLCLSLVRTRGTTEEGSSLDRPGGAARTRRRRPEDKDSLSPFFSSISLFFFLV